MDAYATRRGTMAYPLGGTPQGGVGIIIDVGSIRFCAFFGGTIVKDDGERFVARKAPAPASCPILGTTTTTTSTTSTTTTTTSTSSTTLGTADLWLTKVASPTSINDGVPMSVTFTVTLHNAGPDTATGVEVTDHLPALFTYDSSTASPGSYDSMMGVWSVGQL
jgi:uncharacterized repeat protein (TIGR01451 family)